MDVPALLVEVTRVQEAAAIAEATHVAVVLATETSAQEATMVRDSAALHVKDAKDQAALSERVALERVREGSREHHIISLCLRG
jgi:hypothetical protein